MLYRRRRKAYVGGSFRPNDLSGLLLWLDAADASTITEASNAVSQWDDKSGNGNHATQSTGSKQPTYNPPGRYIDFDGLNNGDGLNTDATSPEDMTCFVVTRRAAQENGIGSALRPILHFGDRNRAALGTPFDLTTGRESLGTSQSPGGPDTSAFWRGNGGAQKMNPYVDLQNGLDIVVMAQYSHSSGDTFTNVIHQRNKETPTTVDNNLTMDWDIRGSVHLGYDPGHDVYSSGDRHYKGRMYEVIVFDRILTLQEKSDIQDYLINKWGITS